jgi:hypothetical protein
VRSDSVSCVPARGSSGLWFGVKTASWTNLAVAASATSATTPLPQPQPQPQASVKADNKPTCDVRIGVVVLFVVAVEGTNWLRLAHLDGFTSGGRSATRSSPVLMGLILTDCSAGCLWELPGNISVAIGSGMLVAGYEAEARRQGLAAHKTGKACLVPVSQATHCRQTDPVASRKPLPTPSSTRSVCLHAHAHLPTPTLPLISCSRLRAWWRRAARTRFHARPRRRDRPRG